MSLPRKVCCTVQSIVDHGGRVYTVDLVPISPLPAFRPGQFLHLTVDDYDPSDYWPESRVFSIASSPRERARIRICYSVTGRYTTKMEQELKVGGQVWIKLPYGSFVIEAASDAVLIAGGTGISAFTAFLEALTPEFPRAVTLVYGARSPGLLLFTDMILNQVAQMPRLNAIFFRETNAADVTDWAPDQRDRAQYYTGRIEVELVWPHLSGSANPFFYLSGPPAMLKSLSTDLLALGVEADRVRTDAWE